MLKPSMKQNCKLLSKWR